MVGTPVEGRSTERSLVDRVLSISKDPELSKLLFDSIRKEAKTLERPPVLMEVCGSHTWAIAHTGIRDLLKDEIELISGPGCPVCVTSTGELSRMVSLSRIPGVIVATYGDLMRVPGPSGSLEMSRSEGNEVEVVFSPLDALTLAKERPEKEVVFLGIGFETTAPGCGIAVETAKVQGIRNFSVLSAHKVMPPALRKVLAFENLRIDGLLLPGHVSTVTGRRYFDFIHREYQVPSVIAGFEACDILYAILRLIKKISIGDKRVENGYPRAVKEEGNEEAMRVLDRVFEHSSSSWRGMGELPQSGLDLKEAYKEYDAKVKFGLEPVKDEPEPPGCDCRLILSGLKRPWECRLFGKACTPSHPVGPCMVSSEGSCRAHYLFTRCS